MKHAGCLHVKMFSWAAHISHGFPLSSAVKKICLFFYGVICLFLIAAAFLSFKKLSQKWILIDPIGNFIEWIMSS